MSKKKNRYSEISGGVDHFGNYKQIIDILSGNTEDIDWKGICINVAKEHPDIFIKCLKKVDDIKRKTWETEVIELSKKGDNKIECIKRCRTLSGMGLAESKMWVEENCPSFERYEF